MHTNHCTFVKTHPKKKDTDTLKWLQIQRWGGKQPPAWGRIKFILPHIFISRQKTRSPLNACLIYQEEKNKRREGKKEEGETEYPTGQALTLINTLKYSFWKQLLPYSILFKIHTVPQ